MAGISTLMAKESGDDTLECESEVMPHQSHKSKCMTHVLEGNSLDNPGSGRPSHHIEGCLCNRCDPLEVEADRLWGIPSRKLEAVNNSLAAFAIDDRKSME